MDRKVYTTKEEVDFVYDYGLMESIYGVKDGRPLKSILTYENRKSREYLGYPHNLDNEINNLASISPRSLPPIFRSNLTKERYHFRLTRKLNNRIG